MAVVISLNRFLAPVDDTVTTHPKTQVLVTGSNIKVLGTVQDRTVTVHELAVHELARKPSGGMNAIRGGNWLLCSFPTGP